MSSLFVSDAAACAAKVDCEACATLWSCVWCPDGANATAGHCIPGTVVGQSACASSGWQWGQCVFAGWVLLLLVGLALLLVLLLIVGCVCCCCCRRGRCCRCGRKPPGDAHREYMPLSPPPDAAGSTPTKTDEWRAKMHAKYGTSLKKSSFSESPDFE